MKTEVEKRSHRQRQEVKRKFKKKKKEKKLRKKLRSVPKMSPVRISTKMKKVLMAPPEKKSSLDRVPAKAKKK